MDDWCFTIWWIETIIENKTMNEKKQKNVFVFTQEKLFLIKLLIKVLAKVHKLMLFVVKDIDY